jgi:tetratricopeptide (TPR) repeat protein
MSSSPHTTRIDITALRDCPESQYLSREQTKELDSYLANPDVGVVGIIADGGFGKTAMVQHWANHLNYEEHGCTDVYAVRLPDQSDTSQPNPKDDGEFFAQCYKHFHLDQPPSHYSIDEERAENLWHNLPTKTILILDSLQSRQIPKTSDRGKINNGAVCHLLKTAASVLGDKNGMLVVVTSRLPLTDLRPGPGYKHIDLGRLSPDQGAKLLKNLHVTADDPEELKAASEEVNGHCLSLVLLAKMLQRWEFDIAFRHEIYDLTGRPKPDDPDWQHATRIMKYYDQVVSEPSDKVFLQMMGLVHRPLTRKIRDHLAKRALFATDVRNFDTPDWSDVIDKLKNYALLFESDKKDKWECHPLIREHYRNTLGKDKKNWQQAHRILIEQFLDNKKPTKGADVENFYRAIHHACLAGEFERAFYIYDKYVIQDRARALSTNEWGLAANEVAALDMFFVPPELIEPRDPSLSRDDLKFLWGRKAFCLTCLGRLDEAIRHREKQREYCKDHGGVQGIVHACEQLSALQVMAGDLREAKDSAQQALDFSDRPGCGQAEKERAYCRLGAVYYLENDFTNCERVFEKAKTIREGYERNAPKLGSEYGIYYRFFKLDVAADDAENKAVQHDADDAFKQDEGWLVPSGLALLVQGIAIHRMGGSPNEARKLFTEAEVKLKSSGSVVYLPYYYLAKAEFDIKQSQNDPNDAQESVGCARQIADSHKMKLFAVDCELVATRIFLETKDALRAKQTLDLAIEKYNKIWPRYSLRITDIALMKAELAELGGDPKAEELRGEADTLINKSGRKNLL